MLSAIINTGMSERWQAVFYGVAIVLALVGAAKAVLPKVKVHVDLFALAFAVFAFVFFYQACSAIGK